jgi:hypothetical protein
MFGYLFCLSPFLLGIPISIASQWYVSGYIAEPFNLGLSEWDLCTCVLAIATTVELVVIGMIVLWVAALMGCIDGLRNKLSNFDAAVCE